MKSTRLKYAASNYGISPALVEEGMVVLTMSLELIGADEGATAILSRSNLDDPTLDDDSKLNIPEELREILGRNSEQGFAAKMHFRMGKEVYNCRVFLIQPQNVEQGQPLLALSMQRDTSVPNAIEVVSSQYHLTDREQEVLRGIAIGLTSKETAERMNISPNTVKSFLRIIMIKMGAATRSGIVGKLLEYSNTSNSNGNANGFAASGQANGGSNGNSNGHANGHANGL
jgi:DNA-binding CsgD family transcriptional regulator